MQSKIHMGESEFHISHSSFPTGDGIQEKHECLKRDVFLLPECRDENVFKQADDVSLRTVSRPPQYTSPTSLTNTGITVLQFNLPDEEMRRHKSQHLLLGYPFHSAYTLGSAKESVFLEKDSHPQQGGQMQPLGTPSRSSAHLAHSHPSASAK